MTGAMPEGTHIGMDGKPCRCTPHSRRKATRGNPPTCPCCMKPHAKCPNARPCIGGCGRMTTAHQTSACGYCPHCAGDTRWRSIA